MAAPRLPGLGSALLRPAYRAATLASIEAAPRTLLLRPPPRALFRSSPRRHLADAARPVSVPESAASTRATGTSKADAGGGLEKPHAEPSPDSGEAKDAAKDNAMPAEDLVIAKSAVESLGQDQAQADSKPDNELDTTPIPRPAVPRSIHPLLAGATPEETKMAMEYHTNSALTTILSMKPPMSQDSDQDKPPHLQAPPYVHHFDTYSLVKSLQDDGGWTEPQSIEAMKAVRALLTLNMEIARDGLVSKGDAEMESYLFRSACSELRTEVRQRRQTLHTEMQSARSGLQHEVDILTQRIGQETLTMRDEIKGMFDERKMSVREERRAMESRIQELNYKITLALNSEMRSEAEGLRFVITRRAVIALAIVVISAMVALRFAKSAENKSQLERKRLEEAQRAERHGPPVPDAIDMNSGDVMKRLDAGDSPGLVSLG